MPPKIYVPFLNIGSVPCAKALKKAPKIFVYFKNIYYLCSQFLYNTKFCTYGKDNDPGRQFRRKH